MGMNRAGRWPAKPIILDRLFFCAFFPCICLTASSIPICYSAGVQLINAILKEIGGLKVKEVLIDSGSTDLLSERVQIAAGSIAIGKICNAEMYFFRCKAVSHELISASLNISECLTQEPALTCGA